MNGLANWLSAFGSIAAAYVALYLANKAARLSATVHVGHRIIIAGDGSDPPYTEYVVFKVVNTGSTNSSKPDWLADRSAQETLRRAAL